MNRTIAGPPMMLVALSMCVALGTASGIARAAPADGVRGELDRLYDAEWQRWLREDPIGATSAGDPRYNDRWPDLSPTAIAAADAADAAALARLDALDVTGLAPADRLNYDIVRLQFQRRVAAAPFKPHLYDINHQGGIQTADEIAEIAPFRTVKDYEDWIARLRAFGGYVDQNIALMETGMHEKRTQPRVIMARIPAQIAAQRVADPKDSPFYAPFTRMPAEISAADRERLSVAGREAITAVVLPAYARLDRFFNDRYLPACRQSIGLFDTPDGRAYYRERIAYHTTTSLSADEIHRIGLAEVARIRGEMDKVIAAVGFHGSFQEFAHELRTDPKFFHSDPTDLLHGYMVIAKSIDPNLVRLFGRLPRTPYGVRPIPAVKAPNTTTAYYQPLAADGSRPGIYFVNLYKPEARPKWEMEVLTAHEAVPGHHLQLALQYEQGAGMPMIRRMADFTAYVEGWGLYAESLGGELGLYADPYQKFGQLTYDMWRSVRLVVDTGMHDEGWSRQQAIDYFMANAPKSELDITNEVDRYISWPGQALAYKIGQMKFLELRAAAQSALGSRFDIRKFHDQVLSTGAVPLPVMERGMHDWIAAEAAVGH